ncbi:unnamed protein product [Urochloa decumbens]|uniref:RING-type E3 ubiquitin transferase n=1 Tax=Urochloa decumbens TaxID=240449 RepID=A0ABC8XTU5_9POAL
MADGGGPGGYLLGGVACFCAGAGCYYLGKTRLESAGVVRSARRFRRIHDLSVLLDSSSGHLPLVTVSGRVRSDTPLIGQQSGLPAAIVEQHVTQHYLKKARKKKADEEYLVVKKTKENCGDEHLLIKKEEKDDVGQWTHFSEVMSSTKKEVPWNLDDGTGHLEIAGACTANGFSLSLGSEVFEKQPHSCGCECTLKILGLKRTERILQIGARLTVVGEAFKDNSGKITIQRPRNSGPFHVSRSSIDQIISGLGTEAVKPGAASFVLWRLQLLACSFLEALH